MHVAPRRKDRVQTNETEDDAEQRAVKSPRRLAAIVAKKWCGK